MNGRKPTPCTAPRIVTRRRSDSTFVTSACEVSWPILYSEMHPQRNNHKLAGIIFAPHCVTLWRFFIITGESFILRGEYGRLDSGVTGFNRNMRYDRQRGHNVLFVHPLPLLQLSFRQE